MSDAAAVAGRLCAECGHCCDGVMFYTVQLQPSDSPRGVAALGMKLKRKRGECLILQPCPALRGTHCTIYADRPARCRRFECRQLKGVASGEIPESLARERIQEVNRRVAELDAMLKECGAGNSRRPLFKRFEKVTATPVDATDAEAVALRERLTTAMHALEALLDREFRNTPLFLAERELSARTSPLPPV